MNNQGPPLHFNQVGPTDFSRIQAYSLQPTAYSWNHRHPRITSIFCGSLIVRIMFKPL